MKLQLVFAAILVAAVSAKELLTFEEIKDVISKHAKGTRDSRALELMEVLKMPSYIFRAGIEEYSTSRLNLMCLTCRAVFSTAFDMIKNGSPDSEITEVITNLCVSLAIQNHNVCSGVVALNVPIISYIVKNEPAASAETFCGLVFQNVQVNDCPITDERFEYTINIPDKPETTPEAQGGEGELKVVFISDVHIDPEYEAFGVANCDEPTCCRKGQNPARKNNYVVSVEDEKLSQKAFNNDGNKITVDLDVSREMANSRTQNEKLWDRSGVAGYWGDYNSCDTPLWTYDHVIEHIAETHNDIDLVYYVGDTIDHGVWETTYELVNDMNYYTAEKLHYEFGDIPVFPVIANHESQPMNQFAPSSVTDEGLTTQWLYDKLAEQWAYWLPADAQQTLKKGGYFTVLVRPGFRVVVLNNNVAYKYNWWLAYDPQDSVQHLQWLVDTLYEAEQAGEKVHILSHIPPGTHDLVKTWTREYSKIVNRFSNTIAGEFNGHTHTDEFKVFYSETDGTPIATSWVGGSINPYSYYNVNYKIITVDGTTYRPADFDTYIFNLTEANLTPERTPHWFMEYNFKNAYGLTDLSPASMDNLIHRMVTSEKRLLNLYISFYGKLGDAFLERGCDIGCSLNHLCKTVVTELWEREKCHEITQLYYDTL